MRKVRTVFILGTIVLALVSCATLGLKPWGDRTPKERALAILEFYNSEYQNTMSMALTPNITEAQKQIVRQKKALLTQLYPLIQLYVTTVEGGGTPSAKDEQAILALIDKLGGKL